MEAKIADFIHWRFTVPHLKYLLKFLSLSTKGNKPQLQERLLTYVADNFKANNIDNLDKIYKTCVFIHENPTAINKMPAKTAYTPVYQTMSKGVSSVPPSVVPTARMTTIDNLPLHPDTLSFQPSPFYSILRKLHAPVVFAHPYSRSVQSSEVNFSIPSSEYDLVKAKKYRVVVISQQYTHPNLRRPLYFPFNTDITVNGSHVQAQHRGIRGHEGSAKPVDVSDQVLRAPAGHVHKLQFRFTVNQNDRAKDEHTATKSFAFAVYVIDVRETAEIIEEIKQRPQISKDDVVREIREQQDEDDIKVETVYSLKDPVAFVRIKIPLRSRKCTHVQCVDAESFLEFQRQNPTWLCSVCNKKITYESLAVDGYMSDILEKAEDDVTQVTVSADGSWAVLTRDSSQEETDSDDEFPLRKRQKPDVEIINLSDEDDDEHARTQSAQSAPQSAPQSVPPSVPQSVPQSRQESPNNGSATRATSAPVGGTVSPSAGTMHIPSPRPITHGTPVPSQFMPMRLPEHPLSASPDNSQFLPGGPAAAAPNTVQYSVPNLNGVESILRNYENRVSPSMAEPRADALNLPLTLERFVQVLHSPQLTNGLEGPGEAHKNPSNGSTPTLPALFVNNSDENNMFSQKSQPLSVPGRPQSSRSAESDDEIVDLTAIDD